MKREAIIARDHDKPRFDVLCRLATGAVVKREGFTLVQHANECALRSMRERGFVEVTVRERGGKNRSRWIRESTDTREWRNVLKPGE